MQPGAVYGQSQIVTLVAALSTVTVHLGVTTPCNEGLWTQVYPSIRKKF